MKLVPFAGEDEKNHVSATIRFTYNDGYPFKPCVGWAAFVVVLCCVVLCCIGLALWYAQRSLLMVRPSTRP